MDDIKTARRFLYVSSGLLISITAGWATFTKEIPVGIPGIVFTSLSIAPYILALSWLYCWQRFYVLSRHENKPEIDTIISDAINVNPNNSQNDIIRKVFPPESYGLKKPVVVRRWDFEYKGLSTLPLHHVIYQRLSGKRLFMFNYMGNDINDAPLFVHFGPERINIKNGLVRIWSTQYWKCLSFEAKTILGFSFEKPIIVAYYLPHLLAWCCLFYCTYHIIYSFF
ncbi:hypothetical protein ACU9D5_003330 [Cronobacter dublinensis]|nr:hypothetical protein [Cronobacter dublinensis]